MSETFTSCEIKIRLSKQSHKMLLKTDRSGGPTCNTRSHTKGVDALGANLQETAGFVWNYCLFFLKCSLHCYTRTWGHQTPAIVWKKIWKYPTTKETWLKGLVSRKCAAVTCLPGNQKSDHEMAPKFDCYPSSGSRGALGAWAPFAPNISSKSCSFQAILRGKHLFWANFGLRAHPLGSKLCWAPWPKSWIRSCTPRYISTLFQLFLLKTARFKKFMGVETGWFRHHFILAPVVMNPAASWGTSSEIFSSSEPVPNVGTKYSENGKCKFWNKWGAHFIKDTTQAQGPTNKTRLKQDLG